MASASKQHDKKTVLITGCSDGGLGAALAIAYHNVGYRVFATARNPTRLAEMKAAGIETLALDVLSDASIAECVVAVTKLTGGTLNVLVNNAGAGYNMPVSDVALPDARKLFDLNLWSYVSTIQAFMPLLLRASAKDGSAMIVNQTSVASVTGVPFAGVYSASKAALALLTESLRHEMAPFGVKVVDLKTGTVKSRIQDNMEARTEVALPPNSIYNIARESVEKVLHGGSLAEGALGTDVWAKAVVGDLVKPKPKYQIWRGSQAGLVWLSTFLPVGMLDFKVKEVTGLDVVIQKVKQAGGVEAVVAKM